MNQERLGDSKNFKEETPEQQQASEELKKMAEEMEDAPKVELTKEEHKLIFGGQADDTEVQKLMSEKGLKLDSGYVKVFIDGKEKFMETSPDDLGTIHEEKK